VEITASCSRQYKAVHWSGYRDTKNIKWVVIHDEEAKTAESAASWFANPNSGGSAHLCIDDEHCFRTLENNQVPWGAASSIYANVQGFHIEQAGYSYWSTLVWKSHRRQMQRVAYKTALHCKLFKIPPYFVKADGLLAGRSGVTTHAEITYASKKGDPAHASNYNHTDPGIYWPRFWFMRLVRSYYAELTAV
jgi:hypothetical protein